MNARPTHVNSLLILSGALCALAVPTTALASPASDVFVVPMESGVVGLGGFDILGIEPVTLTVFDLDVDAQAQWSAAVTTTVGWESDDVRQGAELDVARSALAAGSIDVLWTLSGTLSPLGLGEIPIGPIPISADDVSCAPALSGGDYVCTATSAAVPIVDTPCVPASPWIDFKIGITFTISPEGIVTTRAFQIDDENVVADDDLTLTGATATETFDVPCTPPAESEVAYSLNDYSWTPAVDAAQQPMFTIGLRDPGIFLGCTKLIPLVDIPFGPAIETTPDFELVGAGHTTDMGELLANDVPPTIAPMALFTGDEGSPVTFSASVTSECPIGSSTWLFSDGGTAYGPAPQHTFQDDALYSGQLTVIDITGLDASRNFSVDIDNVAPSAVAGPDTSGLWGVPIAFHGQGVDPGGVDNATLVYSWNWGDGTPGTGGANASHVYANPGAYLATLTVCDDHTCSVDSTNVLVSKRDTTTAYVGANAGVYSASAQLAGSVVDELGNPVAGATVAFTLDGGPLGSAQTNGAGIASRTFTVDVPDGGYDVTAAYAGSSLYEASSATESFEVSQISTALTYTGSVKGSPNKNVALSAKLVDALGRGLAGKVVVFQLGSQTTQATTNTSGVAATTLKLSQKNGWYTLTTSYTPTVADSGKWLASSTSVAFALQSR